VTGSGACRQAGRIAPLGDTPPPGRAARGRGAYKEPVLWLAVIAGTWVLTTVLVLPLIGRCLGSAALAPSVVADEDGARPLRLVVTSPWRDPVTR
jgi:hypothetical protein